MAEIVDMTLWREMRRYRRLRERDKLFPSEKVNVELYKVWRTAGYSDAEWQAFCTDGWKNEDLP